MLALRKTRPADGLDLAEVPPPPPPAGGEVQIAVEAAGICGSDLHVLDWTPAYAFMAGALPVTIGHEFAGRIVDVGSEAGRWRIGDRVTVLPSVTCGRFAMCTGGLFDACRDRTGIGLLRQGAFAARLNVPARNCVTLPDRLDTGIAALAEPFSVAAQALATAGSVQGRAVLVLGPGTIGQAIAVLARAGGASRIVVVGRDDQPRLTVLESMGFAECLDSADLPARADFDIVFEATGVGKALEDGLARLRHGGMLIAVGIPASPVPIDVTRLIRNQQQMRGSHRAPRVLWDDVIAFLADNAALVAPMITHRLPLSRALEGFELAHRRVASKVLLMPEGS